MSQRLSPPQAPKYLERLYPSTQKGVTLIAEDVTDLETHRQRLSDPDGYRPRCCPARLRLGARVLTQVLAASGSAALEASAKRVGLLGTRWEVVVALGGALWSVAELLHRLAPGLRLM